MGGSFRNKANKKNKIVANKTGAGKKPSEIKSKPSIKNIQINQNSSKGNLSNKKTRIVKVVNGSGGVNKGTISKPNPKSSSNNKSNSFNKSSDSSKPNFKALSSARAIAADKSHPQHSKVAELLRCFENKWMAEEKFVEVLRGLMGLSLTFALECKKLFHFISKKLKCLILIN